MNAQAIHSAPLISRKATLETYFWYHYFVFVPERNHYRVPIPISQISSKPNTILAVPINLIVDPFIESANFINRRIPFCWFDSFNDLPRPRLLHLPRCSGPQTDLGEIKSRFLYTVFRRRFDSLFIHGVLAHWLSFLAMWVVALRLKRHDVDRWSRRMPLPDISRGRLCQKLQSTGLTRWGKCLAL